MDLLRAHFTQIIKLNLFKSLVNNQLHYDVPTYLFSIGPLRFYIILLNSHRRKGKTYNILHEYNSNNILRSGNMMKYK